MSSINGCETGVHQKTLNRLVRFIDQFKSMNFANDRVMEQQLESVKKELLTKTAEEYRDSAVARARLKQGLAGTNPLGKTNPPSARPPDCVWSPSGWLHVGLSGGACASRMPSRGWSQQAHAPGSHQQNAAGLWLWVCAVRFPKPGKSACAVRAAPPLRVSTVMNLLCPA